MADNTKFIFVTGGVLSSLGKGLASAALLHGQRQQRSLRLEPAGLSVRRAGQHRAGAVLPGHQCAPR